MVSRYDIAIIGGGVLGASTFFHLAKARQSVCLIEQHRVGAGISAYSGGVVRAFHFNSEQRHRALYSMAYYQDFESRVGKRVSYTKSGHLYFPAYSAAQKCQVIALSNDVSPGTCWMDVSELVERFPFVQPKTLAGGVWEPEGGYIDPVAVTEAWTESAVGLGGALYSGVKVTEAIIERDKIVGVKTNLGVIRAHKYVVAAGISSKELINKFNCDAPLYNKTIQVDMYKQAQFAEPIPCFTDAEYDINGRGGASGVLLGQSCEHTAKHRFADQAHQSRAQKTAQNRFTWPDTSEICGSYCSLDSFSDRELGYVEYLDPQQQVLLLAGFNGTAFKFAPFIAERTRELITEELGE